ncbi:MAG: hypothetical protein ABI592_17105 [Acidobacteriota bacterium]
MARKAGFEAALIAGLLLGALSAAGQEQPPPPPAAAPPAATPPPASTSASAPASVPAAASPTPAPAASGMVPLRLTEPGSVRVEKLPAENPFGMTAESPAAPPPKPVFTEQVVEVPFYAAVHVDPAGRVIGSRRVRDPIPSLAADTKKSFERWSFDPARKNNQPVPTWASVRLDLSVNVRAPKIEQLSLAPITPSTPIPAPLEWRADQPWYDGLQATVPADGSVAVEQADTLAVPKKTKWDADSYKGPFSIRLWVKTTAAGRVERSIPIQASDPVLIPYFRRQIAGWQLRPARANGQAADSWSELSIAGQVGYAVEIKQIANLRKTLPDTEGAH